MNVRLICANTLSQLEISQIIDTQLPLEYRGGDADARLCMEKVIERLWEGDGLASEYDERDTACHE
jgi:hypothetical protein